ncbi:hypothetical protein AcW1_000182 [Taiwanofungus camphoratus]|nr:hypothetical protein AcV5_004079 [Antrodia cinnamomea]KAI0962970.1 hypothetical protein AcW1_000182 [Antrodia cinnamomea]
MASEQTPEYADKLPADAVARCTSEARSDGLFAGLSAGLVSSILGSKVFRFNGNTSIICGVVTGILSGYQFTQAFKSSNLARLRAEHTLQQQTRNQKS